MHDGEATSRVAADEYRKRSALNWEQAAAGWESEADRVRTMGAPITAWLIEHLELQAGATVLELASGAGDVGLAVAAALEGTGTVILSDRARAMVQAARRAAAAAGITNAEMRVLDAESLDLADDAVDRVVCRFAYMLVADRAAAFRETHRVLRPGGRLAFAVWGSASENEWATTLWDVLERHTDLPPSAPGGPGMFALADPGAIRRHVTDAGFDLRAIEAIPVAWSYPDFDAYWRAQSSLNGGLTRLLPTLRASEQAALVAAVREAVEPHRGDGGYRLSGVALGVAADAR